MELFLNFAWLLVTVYVVCHWLKGQAQGAKDWRRQVIAIAILIAILFPAISMSDDLLAVQNAFEADNYLYLRRDHLLPSSGHPVQPAITMLAVFVFAGRGFGFVRFGSPDPFEVQDPQRRELACVGCRPPPIA